MEERPITDLFDTQCWFYDDIMDPYQVFAETFSYAHLDYFRRTIKRITYYASADELFKGDSPGEVITSMRVVRSLLKAVYCLKEKKDSPVEVLAIDALSKRYYSDSNRVLSPWKDFPRSLSIKEFCNPYKVFRKIFKYQSIDGWLKDLELMVTYALTSDKGEYNLHIMTIYAQLTKLIEAVHLINVREVTHVGGFLKNRFNT